MEVFPNPCIFNKMRDTAVLYDDFCFNVEKHLIILQVGSFEMLQDEVNRSNKPLIDLKKSQKAIFSTESNSLLRKQFFAQNAISCTDWAWYCVCGMRPIMAYRNEAHQNSPSNRPAARVWIVADGFTNLSWAWSSQFWSSRPHPTCTVGYLHQSDTSRAGLEEVS